MNLTSPIAVCYTCIGPTYRETVYKLLRDYYFDDELLYYFIITDDVSYFKDLDRKNLVVNHIKDFEEHGYSEKYEPLLTSTRDKNAYAAEWLTNTYQYPFSINRFHCIQGLEQGVKNLCILCTDAMLKLKELEGNIVQIPNMIYNQCSVWRVREAERSDFEHYYLPVFKKMQGWSFDLEEIDIVDAAGRLIIPESLDQLRQFFDIFNLTLKHLYEEEDFKKKRAGYWVNDELILAPIYHKLGWSAKTVSFIEVFHNGGERFWCAPHNTEGANTYEEYLKKNNMATAGRTLI